MSYEELREFYIHFKDTARYIVDLDDFLLYLKWFDKGPDMDLARDAVLHEIFGSSNLIKKKYFDELCSRYASVINECFESIYSNNVDPDQSDQDDDSFPF
jgi:hypothetical protein